MPVAYEETGFLLGAPGDLGETGNESWDEIRSMNLAPNLEKMHYISPREINSAKTGS